MKREKCASLIPTYVAFAIGVVEDDVLALVLLPLLVVDVVEDLEEVVEIDGPTPTQ